MNNWEELLHELLMNEKSFKQKSEPDHVQMPQPRPLHNLHKHIKCCFLLKIQKHECSYSGHSLTVPNSRVQVRVCHEDFEEAYLSRAEPDLEEDVVTKGPFNVQVNLSLKPTDSHVKLSKRFVWLVRARCVGSS